MNMSNSATHIIRFSDTVYGASKGSYIDRCVHISIHMASTVLALKVLVSSFTNMFTYITDLTRVSRINNNYRDAHKHSLVLQTGAQLSKGPTSKFGAKFFVSFIRTKPNVSRIFDSNTLTSVVSRKDKRFCNRMIHNTCLSSFFALMPFRQLPTVS